MKLLVTKKKLLNRLIAMIMVLTIGLPTVLLTQVQASDESHEGVEIVFSLAAELTRRGLSSGSSFTSDGPLWVSSGIVTVIANDALHITNRTGNWNGIDIRRDTSGLQVGDTVRVEGRVDGTPPSDTVMVLGGADAPYSWLNDAAVSSVNQSFVLQFVATEDHMSASQTQYQGFRIQTNDAGANMSFFIDDILITRPVAEEASNIVLYQDFEDGQTGGWEMQSWGGAGTITVDEIEVQEITTQALKVVRNAQNSTPLLNITDLLESGRTYDIGLKLSVDASTDSFRLVGKVAAGGSEAFPWLVDSTPVNNTSWVTLTHSGFIVPDNLTEFLIWLETDSGSSTLYIDEVLIVDVTPAGPVTPPNTHTVEVFSIPTALTGLEVGTNVSERGDLAIMNAGATITTLADHQLLISNRGGNWAGLEIQKAIYPTDWIIVEGITTPGYEVALQVTPNYITLGQTTADETGAFSILTTSVSAAQALDSNALRLNTDPSAEGSTDSITVTRLDIHRNPAALPEVTPTISQVTGLPILEETDLGEHVLMVHIPVGNQWDGLRLPKAAIAEFLDDGDSYSFEVDIFTPRPIGTGGAGLMLQTNGSRWAHLLITPNFPDDQELRHWTRYTTELTFDGRPDLANPLDLSVEANRNWTEIQLVKRGSGSGGFNAGSSMLFFIDNFRIRNGAGDIVWEQTFEDGNLEPFTASPSSIDLQVVSVSEVADWEVIIPEWDMSLESLSERFAPYFKFGNIWSNNDFMNNADTNAFFRKHFNAVTAENLMKVDHMAPATPSTDPADWNFAQADALVDWAESHEIEVIGHTLVWHSQSRNWQTGRSHLDSGILTRAEAMENMRFHIEQVAGRYQGRIYSWDVINEVFFTSVSEAAWQANPDWRAYLRREGQDLSSQAESAWYDAFANGANLEAGEHGSDFVFYSFYYARQYDPNAILYYNDFNEEMVGKREAIAQMVESINERWESHEDYDNRLLIEGIGMQSHYHLDQWATNLDLIRPAIMRFIETGAKVSITELDITIGGQGGEHPATLSAPLTVEQQERQAAAYARLMGYYLEFAEDIDRVSIWGMSDSGSWRAWGHPLLFDGNYRKKAAFDAVYDAVANTVTPPINPPAIPITPTPPTQTPSTGTSDNSDKKDEVPAPSIKNTDYVVKAVKGETGGYGVQVPLEGLKDEKITHLYLDGDDLSIKISKDDFPNGASALEVSVMPLPKENLSDAVKALVGSNQVYNFSFLLDGKPLTRFTTAVEITLPYAIKANENPNAIVVYYMDASGALKIITNGRYNPLTGTVTFKTTHFSAYFATHKPVQAIDISSDYWGLNAVNYVLSRELMTTDSQGQFNPNHLITRGALMDILVKAYGDGNIAYEGYGFTDVDETHIYGTAIAKAKALGWIKGYVDGSFRPDSTVTRAEFATIMARVLEGQTGLVLGKGISFADADAIPEFAKGATAFLSQTGHIIGFNDQTFRPYKNMTYAEIASVLAR